MLKSYFEHESRLAAESHDESSRFLKAELVVSFLDGMDFIRMDDEVEAAHERNLDEWEEFKRRKLGEGKD